MIISFLNQGGGGTGSGVTPAEVDSLIQSAITQGEYINNAEYISSAKTIVLYQDETEVATIDATAFIKDGMVDNVYISGTNLVIDFNTDSGKQDIEIPLSDIFDPSNYYTKTDVDAIASGKADTSALSAYTLESNFVTHSGNTNIHTTLAEKEVWNAKQDTLRFYTEDSDGQAMVMVGDGYVEVYDNYVHLGTDDLSVMVSNDGVTINDDPVVTASQLNDYWTSAQTQTAIDDAKAYYVDFAAMSVQGITDADWDGLVAAINAHRPILVKISVSNGYVNATSSLISDNVIYITGADGNYASTYTFTKNGSNDYSVSISTTQFITKAEKDAWNAKVDASAIATAITSGSTDSEIPTAKATYDAIQAGVGGGVSSAEVETMISEAVSSKQDTLVSGTNIKTINSQSLLGSGNITISGGGSITIDPTLDSGSTNAVANSAITNAIDGKQDTLTAGTGIDITNNVISATGGSSNFVELTQAQYDALVDKDPDALYIISDASEVNLSGYALSSAVTQEITAAVSGKADSSAVTQSLSSKQDTLVSGTNIKTVNNQSLLGSGNITIGGGGGAYYIDIATLGSGITDEDWDGVVAAIDAHRPIYAGYPRQDGGIYYYGVECMNKNVSNTEIVLTVSDDNQHYFYTFTKNGSNDYSYTVATKPYVPTISTAVTSTSTDTEIPTAKAVYDQLGGLKFVSLTQSEYDALVTKDSTTIYFIKNNSN